MYIGRTKGSQKIKKDSFSSFRILSFTRNTYHTIHIEIFIYSTVS